MSEYQINTDPMDDVQINELLARLAKADSLYYQGRPVIMSDKEYDALADKYARATGASHRDRQKKLTLPVRMHSQSKITTESELRAFTEGPEDPVFVSAKMDGISLLLVYGEDKTVRTMFTKDSTGLSGRPHPKFTRVFKHKLPEMPAGSIVRGELVSCTKNCRSVAAGLVNRKKKPYDPAEINNLRFLAFSLENQDLLPHEQYRILGDAGFHTPLFKEYTGPLPFETAKSLLSEWRSDYAADQIDIDGLVIQRGVVEHVTSLCPVNSIAFKDPESSPSVEVTVTDVKWDVTRSGRKAPVIVFDPVTINDRTIKSLTGHNSDYITDNGIGIGAVLQISFRGEVIPGINKVIRRTVGASPPLANADDTKTMRLKHFTYCIKQLDIKSIRQVEIEAMDPGVQSVPSFIGRLLKSRAGDLTRAALTDIPGWKILRLSPGAYRMQEAKLKNIHSSIVTETYAPTGHSPDFKEFYEEICKLASSNI